MDGRKDRLDGYYNSKNEGSELVEYSEPYNDKPINI